MGEGSGVRFMAGQFLKAAAVPTEKAIEMMKLTKKQIEVTMQTVSAKNMAQIEGKLAYVQYNR
jgi:isopentenyl diphosphate isomerase/L-lactate dehydrogenase-like FMN-dependent dehydrogenase